MGVREICLLGDPVLRKECKRVGRNIGADDVRTIADLRDTLENFRLTYGFGRGIAAPQIGVAKRIIYLNMNRPVENFDDGFALIDPEIAKRSRRTMILWDDCFSCPELLVKVRRYLRVTLKFKDIEGRTRHLLAEGDLSELVQHEIDHINGVLSIDRAIDLRHIVYRREWERQVRAHNRRTVL